MNTDNLQNFPTAKLASISVTSNSLSTVASPSRLPSDILCDIAAERARQDVQWNGASPDDKHTTNDFRQFIDIQSSKLPMSKNPRQRLVKIAALAIAALESMNRKAALPKA